MRSGKERANPQIRLARSSGFRSSAVRWSYSTWKFGLRYLGSPRRRNVLAICSEVKEAELVSQPVSETKVLETEGQKKNWDRPYYSVDVMHK